MPNNLAIRFDAPSSNVQFICMVVTDGSDEAFGNFLHNRPVVLKYDNGTTTVTYANGRSISHSSTLNEAPKAFTQDSFDPDALESLLSANGYDADIRALIINSSVDAIQTARQVARSKEWPPLPKEAPVRWKDRADTAQTAPDFIKEIYGPWLGKGLSQNYVMALDKPLYDAFHNWKRRNPVPADLDFPTKSQLTGPVPKKISSHDIKKARQIVGAWSRAASAQGQNNHKER